MKIVREKYVIATREYPYKFGDGRGAILIILIEHIYMIMRKK